MRVRDLVTDSSAFSSVIGVVLLVAVLVIVGSTVALFALELGETTEVGPTASIEFESNYFGDGVPKNDSVTVIHRSGDTLERERLEIRIGGDTVFNETDDSERSGDASNVVRGLVVEVDAGNEFNDLNKPGTGPPGEGDGDSRNVVHQWQSEVTAGSKLVIQERNDPDSYDVIQPGERAVVVWRGDEESATIASTTVAPQYADG